MRLGTLILLLVALSTAGAGAPVGHDKQIIGATAIIEVGPESLPIRARVDTGAQTSSIHAEDVDIDRNGDPRGKAISFTLVNRQGQRQRVHAHVAKQILVKTSEGSEIRYAVPLSLRWRQQGKTVLVTLNDRAHLRYRLLLGRNWLRGDYLVDVERDDAQQD